MNATTSVDRALSATLDTSLRVVLALHALAIHMGLMEFRASKLTTVLMERKDNQNQRAQNANQDMNLSRQVERAKSVEMATSVLMGLNAKSQRVLKIAQRIIKHMINAISATKD